MKQVLVLTASFGEGHNTAAHAIRDGLVATGDAKVEVIDLYARAVPLLDRTVQMGYSLAINRFPVVWDLIFRALDQPGLMERVLWTAGALRRAMEEELEEYKPDLIISTYPLYAYLYRAIQKSRLTLRTRIVTVITDSVGVNSAWHRCLSDAFIVADQETSDLLTSRGVPAEIVHVLGFPVARTFAKCSPVSENEPPPWRLLFMPSTQLVLTLRQLRCLLDLPDVKVTVITGRHQRLYAALNNSGFARHPRCEIVGWTNKMPDLLCSHHAFIGKAGGAIVQEAIAAQCPFFVSHLVPGQEEGNIALIERLEMGVRALGQPSRLAECVAGAFANDAEIWRRWKRNVGAFRKPAAADNIAAFALSLCSNRP